MITLEDVIKNEEVQAFVNASQKQLEALGYTEHSNRHIGIVSKRTGEILEKLGFDERTIELGKIAGYLHDIGNCVNRVDHAHTGAILAYNILKEIGMSAEERTEIMMAIGNHDEKSGNAVSAISAALILADKADVHRTRVRDANKSRFDIHDRVNYAVEEAKFDIDTENKKVYLKLKIDTNICPVIKYFEIFLDRMLMCKGAAAFLGVWFHLEINGSMLL